MAYLDPAVLDHLARQSLEGGTIPDEGDTHVHGVVRGVEEIFECFRGDHARDLAPLDRRVENDRRKVAGVVPVFLAELDLHRFLTFRAPRPSV
ncbi:MAG TPA: hypothetical protein VF883_05175 [Thermoanaerobaculia bacterium]|jgi:hypothetical protein